MYEWVIKNKAGETLAVLDTAFDRSYEYALNRPGSAQFSVPLLDPKITADLLLPGDKELFIYRFGQVVWGGEIAYRQVVVDTSNQRVTVNVKGFFELLDKKIVGTATNPVSYSNTDAGDIAWDLIEQAQTGTNASMGITQGAIQPSKNRDRTYDSFKTVKEMIQNLTNDNINDGFDIEVDANKQFNVYYPTKGSVKSDISFEFGKNIFLFTETQDATTMANQVIALGEGMGTEMVIATANAATEIQTQYKVRKRVVQHKTVSEVDTLTDHAQNEVNKSQAQQQILSVTTKGMTDPQLGSYSVGDSVRVKIKTGFLDIDQYFRIYGIKVRVSNENDEDVELIFNP